MEAIEILKKVYQKRDQNIYQRKYDYGLLLIIGGSFFYSGSPALSALAAFRSGVDMVRIFAPKRAADIIASFSPNLAAYPLDGDYFEKKHLPFLEMQIKSAKEVSRGNLALVIGGGMGRTPETKEAILELLRKIDIKTVIDADAIYAVAEDPSVLKGKPFLLTPHSFEFFVLTKTEVFGKNEKEREEIVKEKAAQLKTTILLKGKPDIISDGERVYKNFRGTPYMTVGGTGDTLSGICGALLARKVNIFEAAVASIYLNCRAGEIASEKYRDSLLATDLIEAIPKVIEEL